MAASQSDAVLRLLICSACGEQMRLKSCKPGETFPDVRHYTFVCDCGVTTKYIVLFSASFRESNARLKGSG